MHLVASAYPFVVADQCFKRALIFELVAPPPWNKFFWGQNILVWSQDTLILRVKDMKFFF